MWKLVKTELQYTGQELWRMKIAYLILLVIFIALRFDFIFVDYRYSLSVSRFQYLKLTLFRMIWDVIPTIFILAQFHLLFRESMESHLRTVYALPLTQKQINYSRIIYPLVMVLMFYSIYMAGGFLYMGVIPQTLLDKFYFSEYTNINVDTDPFNFAMMLVFLFTFGIRSFTEKYGKYAGVFFFICVFLTPVIGLSETSAETDDFMGNFFDLLGSPIIVFGVCLFFCLILYYSFMKRRSYLK